MRVCLGIPVVESVPGEVYGSHLNLAISLGRIADVVIPSVVGVVPYDRARETVLKVALDESCDYLFFVDADMGVPMKSFEYLLDDLNGSPSAVLASGHAYRRGYPFTPTWFKLREGKSYGVTAPPATGIYEIDYTGLFCCVIDLKWVRENLEPPFFKITETESEDVFFCKKIREKGGVVLGDSRLRIDHLANRIVVNDETADYLRGMFLQRKREGLERESNEVLA